MLEQTSPTAPRDPNRVYVSTAPDGSLIAQQGDAVATFENPVTTQKRDQAEKTRAVSRLDRLTGGQTTTESNIIRLDIPSDSEPWFIRRLSLEDVTRVGVHGGRDEEGNLNINEKGIFTGLLAAMLFVAVCNEDGSDYFTVFGEAFVQAAKRHPKVVEVNADLFARILAANPGILPEAEKGEKKRTANPTGSATGIPARDFTRSVVAAPPRGSKRKRSTAKRR